MHRTWVCSGFRSSSLHLFQPVKCRQWSNYCTKAHFSSYIHNIDTAEQPSKLSKLQMQGCWSEWDSLMNIDFSWKKLTHGTSNGILKFLLNSTRNTLPTPDNLHRWGVSRVEASCKLCGGICTLRHILTGCPTALWQGWYTWRHNSVRSVLRLAITNAYRQRKVVDPSLPYITFVKPGEPAKPSGHPPRKPLSDSLLAGASDWTFLFDLHEGLVFPPYIALTSQRPDAVIFSNKLKIVILLELTVPIEDRLTLSESLKTSQYSGLISECHSNGWKTRFLTIEIGCRGYVSDNLINTLKLIGISSRASTRKACSSNAYRCTCSYILYLNRIIQTGLNILTLLNLFS